MRKLAGSILTRNARQHLSCSRQKANGLIRTDLTRVHERCCYKGWSREGANKLRRGVECLLKKVRHDKGNSFGYYIFNGRDNYYAILN